MKRLLIALAAAALLLTASGCVTVVEDKPPYGFFFGGGGMVRVNHKTGEAWLLTPNGWMDVEKIQQSQQPAPRIEIR